MGNLIGKFDFNNRTSDVILALSVIFILLLLLVPFTGVALDTFISLSIFLAITTLLIALYSDEPLAFNSFPSFLLFLTLFRLGLNIAATRMILTEAHAGQIIQTFGEVVTGGNPFVGFLIFLLLTGVNFIVITKGSGRIAEVAARFMLDSLPGKQLSIDADVTAGLIDEEEAKRRRDKITTEADFYGAMDGASKFVRGDAIASVAIIFVNLFGGFIIGLIGKGMSLQQVVQTYVTLTVGDGLVTQIPALLISVAAGILVTRSSSKENLAEAFRKQLFNNPRVLGITASILLLLGLIPGMPLLVMGPIAGIIFLYAYFLVNRQTYVASANDLARLGPQKHKKDLPRRVEDVDKILFIDPMEIELGSGIKSLMDDKAQGGVLKRISLIRRQIASDLGIVVPTIRIHDNFNIEPSAYVIKIKGNEVATGTLHLGMVLAMNPGTAIKEMPGSPAFEPAFGLPAIWISEADREDAVAHGYIVVDTMTVLLTHLTEVIRSHAHELLNRQEVSKLVDNAKEYASAVINELIPLKMSLGGVLRVLQNLLRERISIRDIVTILEILADYSKTSADPDVLSEYVRQGLARHITKLNLSQDRAIHAITMDPKVEQMLIESIHDTEMGRNLTLHPITTQKILRETQRLMQESMQKGSQPVLLTSAATRPYLKKLIERGLPRLPVISMQELVSDVPVYSAGVISSEVLAL